MRKVLTVFAITFAIVLFNPFLVQGALPAELQVQIDQTKREREVLIAEEARLQAELEVLNKESQTLGGAVKTLDTTRKKLVNDISITQSKISSSNLSIRALENTITDKERQIITHENAIATSIQELQRYDSHSFLSDLLLYEQVSEVWRDRGTLSDLSSRLENEINSLRNTKQALASEKTQKEKAKQDLVSFQSQLSGQKQVVEENQNAKQQLLNQTKSKEAAYQKLLTDNLARQKESENDLYRLEQELRITLDPSLFPDPKHGIFNWPVDNVFITQKFGQTKSGLYASNWHNGVDFRASMGMPVRAVLGGTILGTANTDDQKGCYSYGRWILIKHDNGLSTIYAHLSASLVKKGQRVATGQIIAYSGGTPGANGSGYSTGPHLHLGLFASQGVEIRQFTTSKGCKQVFVPIASGIDAYLDPLDYLPKL
ncbi:MAG: peptidoglycan DD-metalloendopeptidase family protein [bacterium]